MKILLTGGAGYIGSHTVKQLQNAGHQVIVVDNLSSVKQKPHLEVPFKEVDITDYSALKAAFEHISFDAVMHFAAKIEVKESMTAPLDYYQTNVLGTHNLLRLMKEKNCDTIVFSSTAATYGIPTGEALITEETPTKPINVYGRTKLTCEQMIGDAAHAYGWKGTVLRYFNASGASTDGTLGENRKVETHAIPLLLSAALHGTPFKVFGTDYPTPDGTAVRDYVHVQDIADAHVRALESPPQKGTVATYNIGTGRGISVKELVTECERITEMKLAIEYVQRRDGDPPTLVASFDKIKTELGWEPRYSDKTTILNTALYWQRKLASKEQK